MEKSISEHCSKKLHAEDNRGNIYTSINDMWQTELDGDSINSEKGDPEKVKNVKGERIGGKQQWYEKQKTFWDGQPTTIDGVLGGYGNTHVLDADYSEVIFEKFMDQMPGKTRAFEVGAGIGRVTERILKNHFEAIDILDQSPVQIEGAKKNVPFVKNFFCCGMQDHVWNPEILYDCIWLQWFLMYLTDDDLLEQLKKCMAHLTKDANGKSGIIIVKENVRNTGIWLDKDDNSAIRSPMHFDKIFQVAGLEQIHKSDQPGWPKDLFAIKMWVFRIKQ